MYTKEMYLELLIHIKNFDEEELEHYQNAYMLDIGSSNDKENGLDDVSIYKIDDQGLYLSGVDFYSGDYVELILGFDGKLQFIEGYNESTMFDWEYLGEIELQQ